MTKREVVDQIFSITDNRVFWMSGKKYTKQDFYSIICDSFPFYFVVEMDDGRWFAKVYKICGVWDYYIPDTREQEETLLKEIAKRYGCDDEELAL